MNFTLSEITHFALLSGVPEAFFGFIFEEWRYHGITKLGFCGAILDQALKDHEFAEKLFARAEKHGVRFSDAHVPWTKEWALNTPDEYRAEMLKNVQSALEICGEAGCTTMVIHIGDNICLNDDWAVIGPKGRDWLDDSLEKLLPIAEKNKVILCIENIMAPADQPDELIRCFQKFPSSYFGCCYDSGHANVMEYFPGKDPSGLHPWIKDSLWRGKPQFYRGNALKELLPYIVTCHLHDNDRYADQHLPPGQGKINWQEVLALLKQAPNLKTIQNESSLLHGDGMPLETMLKHFENAGFSR